VESIKPAYLLSIICVVKLANVDFCRSIGTLQWYPGHIAKMEKELKEQLRLMDVVIEIRDARIPLSTSHPKVYAFGDCLYLSVQNTNLRC
jgi:hypothetical protein